jgi:hypothetical protein
MTVDEVDRALAEWKSRLQRIDENLVALQLDPVHVRLQQGQAGGLDGVTREQVVPALDAMQELFAQRGLLYQMVERATQLRAGLNRWHPGEALMEIERLLMGPSIVLPAGEVPLARRSLLGPSQTAITPDQLLNAMVAAYAKARDAVASAGEAWRQLDVSVERAAAEADRLKGLGDALGADATPALASVRAQLEAVKSRIARDPLGASQALTDEVMASMSQIEAQLSELQRRRDQVEADLARARALLGELPEANRRAASAGERCRQEIASDLEAVPPGPAHPAQAEEGLAQWLTTLEATAGAGHWAAVTVGLARWLAAGETALSNAREVERASQAQLDLRDELLGRLLARRQQARMRAARGQALDPALEGMGTQAEALLRQVPTPLAQAESLVADYEARLRAELG